jgi:lipopolysaccharide export system protein LptC
MMASEPAAPQRPRYDWSVRARSTVLDARRYTLFVTRMKRALSISAAAVIFAVLAFFVVQRAPREFDLTFERMGTIDNDLAMINPRLTGADAKGNPFVITAKEAVQDAKNPKRATLKTIEADMNTPRGWVNARAASGVVDLTAKTMQLAGGLSLFTDTGYELHTQSASVDLKAGVVRGDEPVTGQGPMGTMRADTFHYDREAGLMTMAGRVVMTMSGKNR